MVRSFGGASGGRPVRWLDTFTPTANQYFRAISEIWPTLGESEATKVQAAFRAQIRRGGNISSTDMAKNLGLSNLIVANRIYGTFGHRIANQLGLKRRGKDEWWFAASMNGGHDPDGHWIWSLRPTLWDALNTFNPCVFLPRLTPPNPPDPGNTPDPPADHDRLARAY